MKPLLALLPVFVLCAHLTSTAQKKNDKNSPYKYGSISDKDFTITQTFDTGTAAVVIADIGNSSFEGNNKGGITMLFKTFKRVKILNKNGFDMADVAIPLYTDGTDEEKLMDLKVHTYNLDNGKVVETKLESSSIFKDKLSKNWVVKKFTFPAVKEGSIIEYTYTVTSDFYFNLHPWEFQGKYPRLWSEYNVRLPQFLDYVTLKQGYLPFYIDTAKEGFQTFNFTEQGDDPTAASHSFNFNSNLVEARWVIKDAPALREEKFTSTIDNHISKISFQLSAYKEPFTPKPVMSNWFAASEAMLKREDFGEGLDNSNNWLEDDLKTACAGATTKLEKAQKIYAYVRDNFTCTDHDTKYRKNAPKQTLSKKNGNVADINLLLLQMLRHIGLSADPVILSTREHGFTYEAYPIMDKFNYVICRVIIDDQRYYLDASHEYLGFGRLPAECYNGHSRVINATLPEIVYFFADSLQEKKTTSVFIAVSEKDKGKMEGSFQSQLGYFESVAVREQLKAKGQEAFFKKVKSAYTMDIDIQEPKFDSLKQKEERVTESYNFTFDKPAEGMLYINPMMAEGTKENYFKSAERHYPVEMPFTMDETYVFNMEIPEGYDLEEIPKSARVTFNGGDGSFDYLVDKANGHIRLLSHIKLNKATFQPDEYESLRNFFGYIVKKHAEQVVLKKKG